MDVREAGDTASRITPVYGAHSQLPAPQLIIPNFLMSAIRYVPQMLPCLDVVRLRRALW
jgi:hypothetical protein